MVFIVKNIKKIAIEWVNIFDFREVLKYIIKFLIKCLLTELNLSHIERSDSTNSIAWMNDSWCFTLSFG
jgi:hypothetical protein